MGDVIPITRGLVSRLVKMLADLRRHSPPPLPGRGTAILIDAKGFAKTQTIPLPAPYELVVPVQRRLRFGLCAADDTEATATTHETVRFRYRWEHEGKIFEYKEDT